MISISIYSEFAFTYISAMYRLGGFNPDTPRGIPDPFKVANLYSWLLWSLVNSASPFTNINSLFAIPCCSAINFSSKVLCKIEASFIIFSVLDDKKAQSLDCFVFDSKGQVDREIYKFNERIEIRLARELSQGRSRMNCTVKDSNGNWRWFGHQFYF